MSTKTKEELLAENDALKTECESHRMEREGRRERIEVLQTNVERLRATAFDAIEDRDKAKVELSVAECELERLRLLWTPDLDQRWQALVANHETERRKRQRLEAELHEYQGEDTAVELIKSLQAQLTELREAADNVVRAREFPDTLQDNIDALATVLAKVPK